MPRPTVIIAEPDPIDALSVRKLVIETAKFNVLTAHSTRECLDLFQQFPKVSVVILVKDGIIDVELCASSIKKAASQIPIIVLSPRVAEKCEVADYTLSSHDPEELVELIRSLAGDPRQPHQAVISGQNHSKNS
jgi:DNA-binding response OmpR family regulator